MKIFLIIQILLLLVVVEVLSDTQCMIGGIKADSCVENKYIFSSQNIYEITRDIDLPIGTSMEFSEKSTVYITNSSTIHFHCKANSTFKYVVDCNQIKFGSFYTNAPNFKVEVDMTDFFANNEHSPSVINLAYSPVQSNQTIHSYGHNDTLTIPLFYANITTSNNISCSYRSHVEGNNIEMIIECEKNKTLSRAIDIVVKHSYCDEYSGINPMHYMAVHDYSVPVNNIYIKEYFGNGPRFHGNQLVLLGFYFRIYPGFDYNVPISNLLQFITKEAYQEKCSPLLPMTVSYKVLTPYGVEPLPNQSSTENSTTTTINIGIQTSESNILYISYFTFTFVISSLMILIIQ